ncbi:hypothetical protein [Panacagrimonas perspica]|uniref:hypothetical protein n=1 Tax=Panacagrimonas perspica TaxID=381431 RepID=UPI00105C5D73|nr:hypothetical protein [Panacagrimonas perspica]
MISLSRRDGPSLSSSLRPFFSLCAFALAVLAQTRRPTTTVARTAPRIGWLALALGVLSLNVHAAEAPPAKPATKQDTRPAQIQKDPLPLDTTTIKGQQGLPKVLNIVPWKRPDKSGMPGRPSMSLVDEALSPLDRGETRRQLRYENDLQATAAPAAATTESK